MQNYTLTDSYQEEDARLGNGCGAKPAQRGNIAMPQGMSEAAAGKGNEHS